MLCVRVCARVNASDALGWRPLESASLRGVRSYRCVRARDDDVRVSEVIQNAHATSWPRRHKSHHNLVTVIVGGCVVVGAVDVVDAMCKVDSHVLGAGSIIQPSRAKLLGTQHTRSDNAAHHVVAVDIYEPFRGGKGNGYDDVEATLLRLNRFSA